MENKEDMQYDGKWEGLKDVLTPGGDPAYICPFCKDKKSIHLNGIESPHHLDKCPNCGKRLKY